MPTRNINLTDHLDRFVENQIEAGQFRNASEVMRAGLRLLEQQTQEDRGKLALLKSLASEAFRELDQGRGVKLDGKREIARFVRKIGRRTESASKRRTSAR
jgi:antitoxin ParD1/3/4